MTKTRTASDRAPLTIPAFDDDGLDDFAPRRAATYIGREAPPTPEVSPEIGPEVSPEVGPESAPESCSDASGTKRPRAGAAAAPVTAGGASGSTPRATPSAASARARREIDAVSRFPSRDVSRDGQLNLKGPVEILDRFRALCKADRRAYYDMLEILMNHYDRDMRD